MQKFKVIPIQMTGKYTQLLNSGEIVSADQFDESNIPALVLQGFLHPLNMDGSEMKQVIITQDMIDKIPAEQLAASPIKPIAGQFTYVPEGFDNPIEHTLTSEDLKNNPELNDAGFQEGEMIEIPSEMAIEAAKASEPGEEVQKNTAKKSNNKK